MAKTRRDDKKVDLEKMGTAITKGMADLDLGDSGSDQAERSGRLPSDSDRLEEIADDQLDLLKRVRSLEDGQSRLHASIQEVGHSSTATARAVHELRELLFGAQKSMAARSAFDAVVPALEEFREMLAGLDPDTDARSQAQIRGVANRLDLVLRSLGFVEFRAEPGELFDPGRMVCVGHREGEPKRVIESLRSGYCAGDVVVHPAAVIIPDPCLIEEGNVDDTEQDSSDTEGQPECTES